MNIHQKDFIDHLIQEDESSPDHEAAMIAMDMRRSMQRLLKLSEEAKTRDALIPVLDDLNLVRVGIILVTDRVESREIA